MFNHLDIRKVRQKVGFCGPASIEMMLSYYGINLSQDEIAASGGIVEGEDGSRIDQLDQAVKILCPNYVILARYNASIQELAYLTDDLNLPVGIEWQGIFTNQDGSYFEIGHYSVVTSVDLNIGVLTILDPDERSGLVNGRIFINDFFGQWWEKNDIPMIGCPGSTEVVLNNRLLFVVVPWSRTAEMMDLGFRPVSIDLMRAHRSQPKTRIIQQDWLKKMKSHDKLIFEIPEEKLTVYEVIGGCANHLGSLLELHQEMFPNYAQYLPYMELRVKADPEDSHKAIDHWWLANIDGYPAGFRMFKYNPGRNCGLGLLMAVRPQYRKQAIGPYRSLAELLITTSLEQIETDAQVLGKTMPVGMGVELQLPETTSNVDLRRGRARLISRYREYGFCDLPVEYYEPPFILDEYSFQELDIPEEADFNRLLFGYFPTDSSHKLLAPDIISNLALAFLSDHYNLPMDHWAVQRALRSAQQDYVKEGAL
jgi:hypothetical protein